MWNLSRVINFLFILKEVLRKMNNKRSDLNIPSEFNLSSYDGCVLWSENDWAIALYDRIKMYDNWRYVCLKGFDSGASKERIDMARERALLKIKQPLINYFNKLPKVAGRSPIKDQSVREYFDGHWYFDDPCYSKWADLHIYLDGYMLDEGVWSQDGLIYGESEEDRELREINDKNSKLLDEAAWKMHYEVMKSGFDDFFDNLRLRFTFAKDFDFYNKNKNQAPKAFNRFFISVDLNSTDECLAEEFKKWLKTTRKDANFKITRSVFCKDDFSRWHTQRLLPYLDLAFWAETQGKKFANVTIGEALFPDELEKNVEDVVRRTVAPHALQIACHEVVLALTEQSE